MNLLNEIRDYTDYVRQNTYIYSLQKQGIDLLNKFITQQIDGPTPKRGYIEMIDYFLAVWIPKHKKYLTVEEAFNIVYASQDLLTFIHKKYDREDNTPLILEYYGEEYMRLYRVNEIVRKMVGDPVISMKPTIIDLQGYKDYKEKVQHKDTMAMYEQGLFCIEEINDEGYLVLNKLSNHKCCRVLMRRDWMYHFTLNDILQVTLKERFFFVYWEIEQFKVYYTEKAARYL